MCMVTWVRGYTYIHFTHTRYMVLYTHTSGLLTTQLKHLIPGNCQPFQTLNKVN